MLPTWCLLFCNITHTDDAVAAPNIQPMPYACAPTTNMYFDYHVGHRKALEVIPNRPIEHCVDDSCSHMLSISSLVAQISGVSISGAAESCRK
jgi:hypothetical protein